MLKQKPDNIYVLGFQIYTGATATPSESKGLAERVVLDLMEPYHGKQHNLYIDNYFYTSPSLLLKLLQKGTYATGTVRSNRKNFPEELKVNTKLEVGQYQFAVHDELVAVLWHDRRDVYVMSTAHNTSVTRVMKRPKGCREKQLLPCPTCIADYNNFMGGVDLADQNLSYYSLTQRKTIKWWKKVFWRLIDLCIVNGWIIFRSNFPESIIKSQRAFRHELICQLVQPLLNIRASSQCPLALQASKGRKPVSSEKTLTGKHFGYRSTLRRKCAVCSGMKTGKGKNGKQKNYILLSKV